MQPSGELSRIGPDIQAPLSDIWPGWANPVKAVAVCADTMHLPVVVAIDGYTAWVDPAPMPRHNPESGNQVESVGCIDPVPTWAEIAHGPDSPAQGVAFSPCLISG